MTKDEISANWSDGTANHRPKVIGFSHKTKILTNRATENRDF
jgi:hypothetical protein